jgi:hypothetical protein
MFSGFYLALFLLLLALIVRGADCGQPQLAKEAAGLCQR